MQCKFLYVEINIKKYLCKGFIQVILLLDKTEV